MGQSGALHPSVGTKAFFTPLIAAFSRKVLLS